MPFNKSVAKLYELTNAIAKSKGDSEDERRARAAAVRCLAQLNDALCAASGRRGLDCDRREGLVSAAPWPEVDEKWLVDDTVTLPIQINGKRRSEIKVPADMAKAMLRRLRWADPAVIKALDGGAPKKLIVVPGRIVNVVV